MVLGIEDLVAPALAAEARREADGGKETLRTLLYRCARFFGGRALDTITRADALDYKRYRSEGTEPFDTPVGTASVRNENGIMRRFYNWHIDQGLLPEGSNPFTTPKRHSMKAADIAARAVTKQRQTVLPDSGAVRQMFELLKNGWIEETRTKGGGTYQREIQPDPQFAKI